MVIIKSIRKRVDIFILFPNTCRYELLCFNMLRGWNKARKTGRLDICKLREELLFSPRGRKIETASGANFFLLLRQRKKGGKKRSRKRSETATTANSKHKLGRVELQSSAIQTLTCVYYYLVARRVHYIGRSNDKSGERKKWMSAELSTAANQSSSQQAGLLRSKTRRRRIR